jgi:hypothetical protein
MGKPFSPRPSLRCARAVFLSPHVSFTFLTFRIYFL